MSSALFAFYEDEHAEDNSPCVINCSKCNVSGMVGSNPVHNFHGCTTYI